MSLCLTPFSTTLQSYPYPPSLFLTLLLTLSLFPPLHHPLFDGSPSNPHQKYFCTAVSESPGSGEGKKVENNFEKRFGSKFGEFRKKLRIAEVKGGADEGLGRVGQSINIMGWVRTLRSQSNVTFIEINDGSCLSTLQCVMNPEADGYDQVEAGSVLNGASIFVQGTIVANQGTKQKVELKVEKLIMVRKCDSSYPIQKKRVSWEFLRSKAHLRPKPILLERWLKLGTLWLMLHTSSFKKVGLSGWQAQSSQHRIVKALENSSVSPHS